MTAEPTDQDRWHELTEILTNSEAEYRRMAMETFADSHDPMNAFRWQQRAEGLHIALGHVRRIGGRPSEVSTLIERSSLGTPESVALRKSVDDDTASGIVARACALAGGTLGMLHLQDVLDVLSKAKHCCGCDTAYDMHCTCACHEVKPATPEVRAQVLADVMAVPRDLLDGPHVDLMAEMRKRLPADNQPITCGFAFVGNVGEFTCDRYAPHDGKHRNYIAEFEWTDEVTK